MYFYQAERVKNKFHVALCQLCDILNPSEFETFLTITDNLNPYENKTKGDLQMKGKTTYLATGAVIAALYVVLTLVSSAFGLSSGIIQIRISEALTILPMFTPAAIPGLFVGCFIANLLTTGVVIWDVVFGSLATLIGALGTYYLGKNKWIAPVFPIAANVVIVPFVLQYAYHLEGGIFYFMLTVGAGEIITCGILGLMLYGMLIKTKLADSLWQKSNMYKI